MEKFFKEYSNKNDEKILIKEEGHYDNRRNNRII